MLKKYRRIFQTRQSVKNKRAPNGEKIKCKDKNNNSFNYNTNMKQLWDEFSNHTGHPRLVVSIGNAVC